MEPINVFYYGSILAMLILFAIIDYYFFRNTIKERNWKMFAWVGGIILVVGLMIFITTYL